MASLPSSDANVPVGFEINVVRLFGLQCFFGMSRALRTIRPSFIQFSRETRSISVTFFLLPQLTEGQLRAFILIAYYTAGRHRSVETLHKSQIDLQHSRINLRASDETVLERKSRKRRPIVPLFSEIRPVVEQLMRESPNEWLFGSPVASIRRFTRICARSDNKPRRHVLRHSRATHLLHDGISVYVVAKLLGDTVAMIERVLRSFLRCRRGGGDRREADEKESRVNLDSEAGERRAALLVRLAHDDALYVGDPADGEIGWQSELYLNHVARRHRLIGVAAQRNRHVDTALRDFELRADCKLGRLSWRRRNGLGFPNHRADVAFSPLLVGWILLVEHRDRHPGQAIPGFRF